MDLGKKKPLKMVKPGEIPFANFGKPGCPDCGGSGYRPGELDETYGRRARKKKCHCW